jgi:hypothetical protein
MALIHVIKSFYFICWTTKQKLVRITISSFFLIVIKDKFPVKWIHLKGTYYAFSTFMTYKRRYNDW